MIVLMVWVWLVGTVAVTYACGGGWAPSPWSSVTTSAGQNQSEANTTNSYFIFRKGVSSEMFRDRELQPILQRTILEGNERKTRKGTSHTAEKNDVETTDSTAVRKQADPVVKKSNLK